MKHINLNALAATIVLLSVATANSAPGYQTTQIEVAYRETPLPLHIWYPANEDGVSKTIGKNAIFSGVDLLTGATPKSGKFPVVLLSHGSGGNAANLSWIGSYLAERGMIVVSTNHPGTTSRDSSQLETLKIWQRPADFSAILDFLQETPPGNLQPDMDKVGAVGFSLGGYTVLGLGGATVKKQKYIDYCVQFPKLGDCKWYSSAGVDLSQIDAPKFEQSNLDKRIKTIVAIDPALAPAYTEESLAGFKLPSLIINLGAQSEITTGINGTQIAGALENATYSNIKDATHFSFLGLCTAIGKFVIKVAGEDPICSEVGQRTRADIHKELKVKIGDFLENNL